MSTAVGGPSLADLGGTLKAVTAQAEKPPDGVAAWAAYAKERYDAAEKRLADFRNWARQLAAAMGAVIGLQIALGTQIFKTSDQHHRWTIAMASVAWLLIVFSQVRLLRAAIQTGYIGQEHRGPEAASVVANHISSEAHTRKLLGAYYANGGDRIHAVAENVVLKVSSLARGVIRSLDLLFVSFVLAAVLALFPSR